jgi:ectoine hydroxylase-related dioxygenase (phytanoyl-CoA dioxygenase family)
MFNQLLLYCDNILHRNRYLANLNQRIGYFKDQQSAPSVRVFDELSDETAAGDFRVPEVDASQLTVEILKTAIREKGCLIARNFFASDEVAEMRAYVDHAFAINDDQSTAVHKYLSKQIDLEEVLEKTRADIEQKQKINSTYTNTVKTGSTLRRPLGNKSYLTAQTPMLAEKLLKLYEKKQLKTLLRGYFGNEPCLSVYKWVMRRSGAPDVTHDFHQDGAFMGDDISSLNCWIPLSDCGAGYSLHGMDIVPVRLVSTFAKGSGALNWTISPQSVVEKYSENSIVTPTFRTGDAFFFDHLLVHRTQCVPSATEKRYAIETWFFDSVNFPKNQIPLKW